MKKFFLYIFILSVLMMSCEASRPSYVLDSDEMEDVLYDIHRAHFSYSDYNDRENGSRQYALFLNVLKKHEVTDAEWDSSMVYYTRNAHELERIYERLFERVNTEAAAMGAGVGEIADTTDIWKAERQILLFDYLPYTTRTWNVESDSLLSPGDRVTLRFNALFLSEAANRYVTVILALRLTNDSVVVRNQTCSMSGQNTLIVTDDRSLGIKSVYGMFMMNHTSPMSGTAMAKTAHRQIFSISDIRLTHEPGNSRPLGMQPAELKQPLPEPDRQPEETPVRKLDRDTMIKTMQEPLNPKQYGKKTRFTALPQRIKK